MALVSQKEPWRAVRFALALDTGQLRVRNVPF